MTQLDDVEALRALDAGDMLGAVASLPRHAREGYDLAIGTDGLPLADGVTGIAFCGMGGSGIAGDVLRATYGNRLTVPIQVVRSPVVPAWVGPHSLVVCSSYITLVIFTWIVRASSFRAESAACVLPS